MTQHKWHKEIKAWADGAEIEWWNAVHERWEDEKEPMWCVVNKYRIKPQPKEPQYLYVYEGECSKSPIFTFHKSTEHYVNYIGKIKLEVDDETN
jgi:hypothetical protein